jgi:hypothetical protein
VNASCPQCTGPVELTRTTGSLMSGWLKEYHHCDHCRITIQVEYQIIPDHPSPTSGEPHE